MAPKESSGKFPDDLGEGLNKLHIPVDDSTDADSTSVSISIWNPDGQGECWHVNKNGARNWGELLMQFQEVPIAFPCVTMLQEFCYRRNGSTRVGLQCQNAENFQYCNVDVEDGLPVSGESQKVFIWRFLRGTSILPSPTDLMPCLIIHNDAQMMRLNSRRLALADLSILFDLSYVVMISGIRCGSRFFWRLVDENLSFCDAETGQIFAGCLAIPSAGDRRHVHILMREGDRTPFIRLPSRTFLDVRVRSGVEVGMVDGRIRVNRRSEVLDPERWETPKVLSLFEEEFTDCCRCS